MKRWLKYKYLLLLRAKGGPSMVAKGFSVGLAVEMFTLPTMGLAFFLIFPFVYIFRASLAGALLGFVFGKIIYIPFAFLNSKVGGLLVNHHFMKYLHFFPGWMEKVIFVNMKLIVGGIINGTLLGLVMYFPVKTLLQFYADKRRDRRKQKKMKIADNKSG
ncbi:DUF2062 domain-containing protein [Ferviditalea candida]|uniref:DUF2062 domain-containing protein n=1 Tax=Ferviditalea candida TaxID=3108399 RepID=A0ABU5ZLD1_9BACL|nr:DUF2062 domain-containing protein [Paenibacillaceae bacterium T2]